MSEQKFSDYYTQGLKTQNKKNIEKVKELSQLILAGSPLKGECKKLITKIENHLSRFGMDLDVNTALSIIVASDLTASLFAMPASKQNMSEALQKKFLSEKNVCVNKLPGMGPNAIRLMDGSLIKGDDRGGKATKSMDFLGEKGEYIFAKVTVGSGGGQDNQYRDVLDFLKKAQRYDKKHGDKQFVALVDGDYYTHKKIASLNEYASPNIRITTSDEY